MHEMILCMHCPTDMPFSNSFFPFLLLRLYTLCIHTEFHDRCYHELGIIRITAQNSKIRGILRRLKPKHTAHMYSIVIRMFLTKKHAWRRITNTYDMLFLRDAVCTNTHKQTSISWQATSTQPPEIALMVLAHLIWQNYF